METENHNIFLNIVDNKVFSFLFDKKGKYQARKSDTNLLTVRNEELVKAFCILSFDDEIGQITENVWPKDSLDKYTLKQVSGLGFPESNSSDDSEVFFIFRIRENYSVELKNISINDQKFLNCYTLFIQKRNQKYKRGYMQKSIVIISPFYYKHLFQYFLSEIKTFYLKEMENENIFKLDKLAKIFDVLNKYEIQEDILNVDLAGLFQNKDEEDSLLKKCELKENNLRKSLSNISKEDNELDIEIVTESEKKAKIEEINKKQSNLNVMEQELIQIQRIPVKFNLNISLFPQNNNFFEFLSLYYTTKIWNLWELVITETPLMISADSPQICSEVSFILSSLIYPLKYAGDIRPYFTIYDADFKDYRDEVKLKYINTPIFGVINPICLSTFKDWPVLHFDDLYFHEKGLQQNPTKAKQLNYLELINSSLDLGGVFKKKFCIPINKALIKTFVDTLQENSISEEKSLKKLNMYIRMHLIELNNDFMRTFDDFLFVHEIQQVNRLSLLKKHFSIFEIFKKEKFIKYLQQNDIYFNSKYIKDKKKMIDLYSHFIKTKCFAGYLKHIL
jgi:hypothetical protein